MSRRQFCAGLAGFSAASLGLARTGRAQTSVSRVDAARIQQRGEAVSRYATTFDVVDVFKPLRLKQT